MGTPTVLVEKWLDILTEQTYTGRRSWMQILNQSGKEISQVSTTLHWEHKPFTVVLTSNPGGIEIAISRARGAATRKIILPAAQSYHVYSKAAELFDLASTVSGATDDVVILDFNEAVGG